MYIASLGALLTEFEPTKPEPTLSIANLRFDECFHGLEIESPWLMSLAAAFAERSDLSTRTEAIRCNEWLHLSFAYQFRPEEQEPLVALADEVIDVASPVHWMLRLYQRHSVCKGEEQAWVCHREWRL